MMIMNVSRWCLLWMNVYVDVCCYFCVFFCFVCLFSSFFVFILFFFFLCVFFLSPFMLLINVGKCWKSACTVTLLVTKCINPRPGRKLRHETVSVCRVPNEPIVFMYVWECVYVCVCVRCGMVWCGCDCDCGCGAVLWRVALKPLPPEWWSRWQAAPRAVPAPVLAARQLPREWVRPSAKAAAAAVAAAPAAAAVVWLPGEKRCRLSGTIENLVPVTYVPPWRSIPL